MVLYTATLTVAGAKAKSGDINTEFLAIETAFAALPTTSTLSQNIYEAGNHDASAGDPTSPTTSVSPLYRISVAGTITGAGAVVVGDDIYWNGTNWNRIVSGTNVYADNVFRIQDDGDATKQIAFQASAITTGTIRTVTMPDANVDLGNITYAQMQNVSADERLLGNIAGSSQPVAELTQAQVLTFLGIEAGSTADQTSIVGITGTGAEFDTAVTDQNFAFSGGAFHDGFSDFAANEHLDWTADLGSTNLHANNSVNAVLALTAGEVTQLANIGSTTISAADWTAVALLAGTNTGDQTSIVGITGTGAQFDTANTDGNFAFAGGSFHDGFSDFAADEHVAHAGVDMIAGVGLSGGGTIAATRTFTVDLNELTTETTIDAGDFIAMVDITDSGSGKITFANLEAILNHDSLAGFVTNEHLDWTADLGGTNLHANNSANGVLALVSGEVDQLANIGATAISLTEWAALAVLAGTNTGDQTENFNKSITLENPISGDEATLFFTEKAITVTEIRAVLIGSSTPSVAWQLRYHATRSNTGTLIDGNTTTSTTTGDDITSITDATIAADTFVWVEADTVSGTVLEFHLTMIGTVD